MYTIYYINQSFQINTIEVATIDTPVLIPENLHFIALRKGIDFIDHPNECISFTHLERLAIASRLDDLNEFANHPWRLKNTLFSASCRVDPIPPPPVFQILYFSGRRLFYDVNLDLKDDLFTLQISSDGGLTWYTARTWVLENPLSLIYPVGIDANSKVYSYQAYENPAHQIYEGKYTFQVSDYGETLSLRVLDNYGVILDTYEYVLNPVESNY